jgi:uncharacterized protein (DUF4415 family)
MREARAMQKEYDFSGAKRGAVVAPPAGKTRITIRIDDDILSWFRERAEAAGGGNYQSLMNEALRAFIAERRSDLATVLRRIVREELRRARTPKQAARAKAA